MTILLRVIHYLNTNSIEATWVDIEKASELGDEEHGIPSGIDETPIRCHSYSDAQIQMFRDDVDLYGGDIVEYEKILAEMEANVAPVIAVPAPIPQVISRAQGLLGLEQAGLLASIIDYMKTATRLEQIAWDNIQQFERASPMLNALCGNFGLSSEEVDSLFIEGSKIVI